MKAPSLSSALAQVLICRNYRGDVDMSEVEHFMPILMEKEEEGMLSPILAHGGVRFMWIKHNNLYCILLQESPQGTPWWACACTCAGESWQHLPWPGRQLARAWQGHKARPCPAVLELPAA